MKLPLLPKHKAGGVRGPRQILPTTHWFHVDVMENKSCLSVQLSQQEMIFIIRRTFVFCCTACMKTFICLRDLAVIERPGEKRGKGTQNRESKEGRSKVYTERKVIKQKETGTEKSAYLSRIIKGIEAIHLREVHIKFMTPGQEKKQGHDPLSSTFILFHL